MFLKALPYSNCAEACSIHHQDVDGWLSSSSLGLRARSFSPLFLLLFLLHVAHATLQV